jgi:splicing factor 3B subunit 1
MKPSSNSNQNNYSKKMRALSPERHDPFKDADKTPDVNMRTYKTIRTEQMLENERQDATKRLINDQRPSGFHDKRNVIEEKTPRVGSMWDMTPQGDNATPRRFGETPTPSRLMDPTPFITGETPTPRRFKSNWDNKTPLMPGMTPNTMNDATPTPVTFLLNFFSTLELIAFYFLTKKNGYSNLLIDF